MLNSTDETDTTQIFPYKPLKWDDFRGTPDDSSHFLATTY